MDRWNDLQTYSSIAPVFQSGLYSTWDSKIQSWENQLLGNVAVFTTKGPTNLSVLFAEGCFYNKGLKKLLKTSEILDLAYLT